jgi:replicative DNA helicase
VPGQFITLAARPGAGKSAMAMMIAEHLALAQKLPVGFVSLEMSARSLGLREVFQHAGADLTKFLNGFLIDQQINSLTEAVVALRKAPIWIDESPRMAIEDLEVRARRMKRAHDIQLLVIDYFQLLYSRNPRAQWSKSDELANISMRLKALAKELHIPILVCAQMNRQIEQDANRRPRLADLKDTGQLEQDSDVVIFLWKPVVTFEPGPSRRRLEAVIARVPVEAAWKTWENNEEGHNWRQYLSVINATVEKQREGRSGVDALMVFIKPWTRFVDAYTPAKGVKAPEQDGGLFNNEQEKT